MRSVCLSLSIPAYSSKHVGGAAVPSWLAAVAPPTILQPWWSLNSPSTDILVRNVLWS